MTMDNVEKQSPVRQSFCGSLSRDGHWKCFTLTFLIAICLTAISWCRITNDKKTVNPYLDSPFNDTDELGPCKEGYIYIPVAFVIMLYLVYLVECWHSHIRLELKYKVDMPTVYSTISAMQSSPPVIWWKSTCYHYVRRTRRVMRYRNGDAFSSTQVYYERVDSSTAGAAFNFSQCGVKDISRPIYNLEKFQAIKIKISKGFSFANVETEYEFEEQRAQFFQDYETRDDYMEGREGMDLMNVDFKEYMIAFSDPNRLPWYVSHTAFWFASVLLLSWPLRTIIEYKTAHLHYHIHKLFGSNYLDTENYPNLMTRVNTMNSDDLEMSIRNNNVIVPSYSEAMLNNAFEMQTIRDYGATKSTQKFPRSMTNVTLAARGSANVISNTPAITMNRVKRFNSCSAFGDQPSPEAFSSNSGTIRNQITQLFRDRQFLNNKRNSTRSSVSVAGGLPFTSRLSDRTPDGIESIRSSFSTYSVTTSRHNQNSTINNDVTTTSGRNSISSLRRSFDLRRSIPEICYRNGNAHDNNNIQTSSRLHSRPSSVILVSDRGSTNIIIRSTVDMNSPSPLSSSYHTPSIDSSLISHPPLPCASPSSSSSTPNNNPSCPPDYEVALRTCQVANNPTPPCPPNIDSQSIQVIRDNSRHKNTQSSSATPAPVSRDRPSNSSSYIPKRPTSIEPIINTDPNVNSRNATLVTQSGFNLPENSLPSTSYRRGQQFKLKSLPKVTVPLACDDIADDCDVGTDSDDVDIQQRREMETPNSISSRECQFHGADASDVELLPPNNQNLSRVTLIQEHSAIGLSHGIETGNEGGNERPDSPIRMETSV